MISLLVAIVALLTGVAVCWAIARPRSTQSPSTPPPVLVTATPAGRAPQPDPIKAPDHRLAIVMVAVDETAAAARLLGEGIDSETRIEVAEALRAAVRRRDICTPWRDDCVVAIIPGIERQQAPALRWRVQRALSEIRIVTHAGEEVALAFRVASACSPDDGLSEADLLVAAEEQLARDNPAPISPAKGANAHLRAALPILHN